MSQKISDHSSQWEEVRPSRISVALIHSNRLRNTWGNSKPYLSGDLFSDEADVSFFSPRFRRIKPSVKAIRQAKVIFCPSSRLGEVFDIFSGILNPTVVICGNDDHDFTSLPANIPATVKHLFLQNSFIPNSSFTTALPIGLENLRWGKNGFPRLMKNEVPWESRKNKVMVGPFGLTHQERYVIRESIPESNEVFELFTQRLSPQELSHISQHFKFIAAVRGNGVDTHRHWETAYRGSYAIVKRDDWSCNFRGLDLPFIEVEEFSTVEISKVTSMFDRAPKDPKDIPALWWPYWRKQILEKLD